MITLYSAMLVTLGFLLAALLLLVFLPAYRRRIERFTSEAIRRSLPMTETEIRAAQDRVRAEYAIEIHKLEMKLEVAGLTAARQSVDINRRDAKLHELQETIAAQKMGTEEHENARRVLEQAIMDRLPKVEQRLVEARRLLVQRDREIEALNETSKRQGAALEEASQINVQQSDELSRLKTALATRAARNRETVGDPRFDGEVALRSEIEALRATTRDQTALIERLQASTGGAANESQEAQFEAERQRLRAELARVEAELRTLKAGEQGASGARAGLETKVRELEQKLSQVTGELTKANASLSAYEQSKADARVARDGGIAARAEINALKAEVEENKRTIQSLRAEIAAGSERLARQAQHFRDELRRLGTGTRDRDESRVSEASAANQARRSLAERIAEPRVPRADTSPAASASAPASSGVREGGFLKALNGGAQSGAPAADASATPAGEAAVASTDGAVNSAEGQAQPRRARLLERISSIEKKG